MPSQNSEFRNQKSERVVAGFPCQNSDVRCQRSERVVAGFPCQNSDVRCQRSERVVAGLCACRTQPDTDTRFGCDENKIDCRRGGSPCPPEHSSARTRVPAVQETANAHAPVGRGLAPAVNQSDTDTRFGGSDFPISAQPETV